MDGEHCFITDIGKRSAKINVALRMKEERNDINAEMIRQNAISQKEKIRNSLGLL
jgi:hypothetical protein